MHFLIATQKMEGTMIILRKPIMRAMAIFAVIAGAGCTAEPGLDNQLNETQTKQRAQMLIPSSTLFGFELRSQPGLPACSSISAEQKPTCSDGETNQLQAS